MKTTRSSRAQSSKLVIVALEGCHGCGKTALVEEFEAQGYSVLDEAFLDMPSYALHPQSLLMETSWVCSWFERVLRIADRVRQQDARGASTGPQVYIADRSPFSAVLYSANGHLLEPVIREQMREVQRFANVQFYNVHVRVERSLLWQRIVERLQREPERIRYNEHKQEWMDKTLEFYDRFAWDLTVPNDEHGVATIADRISGMLVEQDADFRAVYELTKQQRRDASLSSSLMSCCSSMLSTDSENESGEESHPSSPESSPLKAPQQLQQQIAPVAPMRSIISFNNANMDGF
jgi:thymidylate kinase